MHPTLFDIGFFHVRTYGACMAVGFLVAWHVISWLCKRTGRDEKPLSNLVVSLMISGIVGSRIAYVIEHWQSEFAHDFWQIIRVDQGGLMFYGGFILASVMFFTWCRIKKQSALRMADLFATVVPLAHAFGRLGCFFYGCCYGRQSSAAWAVRFPRQSPAWYEQFRAGLIESSATQSLPVLPTQLVESACCLILFGILLPIYLRNYSRRPGLIAGCYLVGYAITRFTIEILRGDPRAQVGIFSISQTISFLIAAAGIAFITFAFKRKQV